MKSLIKKTKLFCKFLLNPIPNVEKELIKVLNFKLHFLSMDHIREILRLIFDEVKKSRSFGLYIEKAHLEKEELLFLALLNDFGGIHNIRTSIPYEEMSTVLFELAFSNLGSEAEYYHAKSKFECEDVNTKYSLHINSVIARFLHEIYCVPNKGFGTD